MMRMQFGKPIASFQSMKHKQADMLLEVELAKSAAYYAAASLAGDGYGEIKQVP
jgi:alkylation response protein AidB-like acyl-CoA dehydrogenase